MTPDESTTAPTASDLLDFRPGSFCLRNTWFPVAHTNRIRSRPVLRSVHGEPVFLWRNGGELNATSYSPKGLGPISRDESEFTTGGHYPLLERYGYAWVWYGDPEDASSDLLPSVPTIPEENSPHNMQRNSVFDCSYELYCENLLDLTHADFLHSYLMGDALSDDDEVTVTSTSETVTMVRHAQHRRTPKAQRPFVKSEFQDFRGCTLVHVRSGATLVHADFRPGPSLRMLIPATPEGPNRTRAAATFNLVRCTGLMRNLWTLNSHRVTREDNWALRSQNAMYFNRLGRTDMNSRFDRGGVRFRRLYVDLVNRQRAGDFAYRADADPSRDVREEMGLTD